MIQKCPSTDGPHETQRRYEKIGTCTERERLHNKNRARITADQGLKIQDLCAWKSDNYIVCDVAFLRCFQLGQEGLERIAGVIAE